MTHPYIALSTIIICGENIRHELFVVVRHGNRKL